ncbi:hypothetical protein QN362_14045 [Actimicrobium sp. CCC2.4]|uniref:hypothetical protein n=1 Tax=Actimicrobium sp. CCC2.4 TaxID=3048606 RepID=UPI002AC9400B|nr:hypothetical protein [Actimicrobium sp. CCC2.4]MEB0136458.1 hypothetical protein [Actimicrobium sp. CCC2.4]WPX30818.1 hypothetical protein RHM62_11135 [Actimicrobium sp. CCC2.4]
MAITNVSGSGSVAGSTAYQSGGAAGGTNAAVTQANGMSTGEFGTKMSTMSNKDLTTMLGSPGLSDARKSEIAAELLRRIDAAKAESTSSHAPTAPKDPAATEETDDEKRLKELLKKLKEGKITPEEMKELTGMLAKDKTATDDKPGGSTMTPRTI